MQAIGDHHVFLPHAQSALLTTMQPKRISRKKSAKISRKKSAAIRNQPQSEVSRNQKSASLSAQAPCPVVSPELLDFCISIVPFTCSIQTMNTTLHAPARNLIIVRAQIQAPGGRFSASPREGIMHPARGATGRPQWTMLGTVHASIFFAIVAAISISTYQISRLPP